MTVTLSKPIRPADIAARWNSDHPVGTPVLYWPGVLKGPGRASRTRTPAWVIGGHSAVVSVDGYSGGIALTHVRASAVWGVEFGGSPSPDHVTAAESEAAARRFLSGLLFCGNTDAHLMVDDGHGWHPAGSVTQ